MRNYRKMNGDENINIRPAPGFWQIVAQMFGVGPAAAYEPVRGRVGGGHGALHGGALAYQQWKRARAAGWDR